MNKRIITIIAVILCLFMTAAAKDKITPGPKENEEPKKKTYEDIITKEAKTFKGVFTVHRVGEKLYYEIPSGMLEKDFLWVTQLSKAQTGIGYSGFPKGSRVVRWERFGDNILLRDIKYKIHAREDSPEYGVVKAASLPAVIGSYKIACSAADGSPVIDVTDLFVGDVPEFSAKKMIDAAALDKNRTFLTSVKAFPINIETRVLETFTPKPPIPLKPGERPGFRHPDEDSISVEVHHSMVKLPDTPMTARIDDARVGYFGHTYEEYSGPDNQQVDKINLIHRFRLEKKDPGAEISEPVNPIVFYVGRGIPEKYKPYVKQGIEDWIPAFEQAGFKNAIIGKYAPTEAEDPDWDAEDARYSTIRWLPSTIENAFGPHVADPRSGETLEADVLLFHNVLKLARDWFYVQASPNEPTGQKLPLPDELMGKLLRYIVAHEVGHTLGLKHNYKASYTVPVDKVRDAEFTKTYGHTPSIMDYARFNYIAQPGDGASLIPRVGPYDRFAIEWGYKQFPGVKNPADEKPFLNEIAARQLTDPMVRFGGGKEAGPVGRGDYTAQAEDLGDNAVEATRLGLKNIERIMGYIVPGTSKEGEDYRELKNMYSALLIQFNLEMMHVSNQVGGVEVQNKVYGMEGDVYTPLDAAKQKAAVRFLLDNCFRLPSFLPGKEAVKCLGMHDITTQILIVQKRVLNSLLDPLRVGRIGDLEAAGYKTYPVFDLVGDLTDGIFSEISGNVPGIGIFRRNLQRAYVESLIDNILKTGINGDLRAASRYHLDRLARKLGTYTAGNGTARSHVRDLHELISAALKARRDIDQKEQ